MNTPENEYILKVISEFRSKFVRDDGLMDKYYTYGMGEPGDYTCSMAEAVEDFFKEKLEEAMEQGVMDCRDESHQKIAEMERTRVFAVIEKMKEAVGVEGITTMNVPKHDGSMGWHESLNEVDRIKNAVLASLADEIISQRK